MENKIKDEIKIIGQITEETTIQFIEDTDAIIEAYSEYLEEAQVLREEYIRPFPPIMLSISSPGGSVMYGCTILDRIDLMQQMGIKIDTYCMGMCYSMAFIIYLMGEDRYGGRFCSFMNHSSSGYEEGYIKDMRNNIDFLQRQDNMFDEIILAKTRMTRERLEKANLTCDWIMADEAIELGIINIYDKMKEEQEQQETLMEDKQPIGFRVAKEENEEQ